MSVQVTTHTCLRCHRPLRSPESIARGYGHNCYSKLDRIKALTNVWVEMNYDIGSATTVLLTKAKLKSEIEVLNFLSDLFGE